MEVFMLLVLSIGLCQSKAVHDELGKDNPEVVNAVATAIKVLNEDRSYGNKFGLGVILHAYRIAAPVKKFYIIYQVRETVCPIAADEPWQKCDLLRTSKGLSGNCTALIDIDESQQFTSIEQKCKIRPGQQNVAQNRAKCVGCWHHIKNSHSPEVLHIVKHTIQQFNNQSQYSSLFDIAEMKNAEQQIVNGINYRFEYLIKETNCSKNEFPDLSPECKFLPGGIPGNVNVNQTTIRTLLVLNNFQLLSEFCLKIGRDESFSLYPAEQNSFCKAKAYVDNRNKLLHAQVDCRLQAEDNKRSLAQVCPGCHSPISAHSQELKKPLEAVVKLFNLKSSSDFYFKIVDIMKISGKMLVGHTYRIDFKAQRTNCSKTAVQNPDENCTAVKEGELMTCHALVYVKPWEPSVIPEVTCTDEQPFQTAEPGEFKDSELEVTFFDSGDTINEDQDFWK